MECNLAKNIIIIEADWFLLFVKKILLYNADE